jgi:hypothetical protein
MAATRRPGWAKRKAEDAAAFLPRWRRAPLVVTNAADRSATFLAAVGRLGSMRPAGRPRLCLIDVGPHARVRARFGRTTERPGEVEHGIGASSTWVGRRWTRRAAMPLLGSSDDRARRVAQSVVARTPTCGGPDRVQGFKRDGAVRRARWPCSRLRRSGWTTWPAPPPRAQPARTSSGDQTPDAGRRLTTDPGESATSQSTYSQS